jgi:hypothetical protein
MIILTTFKFFNANYIKFFVKSIYDFLCSILQKNSFTFISHIFNFCMINNNKKARFV